MRKKIKLLLKIRYFAEYLSIYLLTVISLVLGIRASSKLFSLLAQLIGSRTKPNKTAYNNIKLAMPEKSPKEINKIVKKMWNNIGRVAGEFFHISRYKKYNIDKIINIDEQSRKNLEKMKKSQKGQLVFSAHFGNWELGLKYLMANGLNVKTVYRPLNNPFVNRFINEMRGIEMIPKNKRGARKILKELKKGTTIIMLVDQKMNDGIKVPFFGIPSMTAPAIANLALTLNLDIIPARIIRKNDKVKFDVVIEKPLKFEKTKNRNKDAEKIMIKINQIIEGWIRKNPDQWFWVHNRWHD